MRIIRGREICGSAQCIPLVYAPRMKVTDTFGGTFPVTENISYTFHYYYVIDDHRLI